MSIKKPNRRTSLLKKFIQKYSFFWNNVLYGQVRLTPQSVESTHHWSGIMCLTGVDYFSTLAYQPGIALMAVGAMAPLASFILILLTLFGAVPTYIEVAKRSYTGQGSIAMLERMLSGWSGKFAVLALIAFAMTDFFITVTLSASDAAAHIVENPFLNQFFHADQLPLSLFLVFLLGTFFYIGIREVLVIAIATVIPYLILSLILILRCDWEIYRHPALLDNWLSSPVWSLNPMTLVFISVIAFPKLALGLSGFETGVAVMPLISNDDKSSDKQHLQEKSLFPQKRFLGTKKLLITAGSIMSLFLLISSFTSVVLIDPKLVANGGEANGRALSYLAHLYLGTTFGSIYDLITITILWFAGASAMAGLLAILPRYLPRFGMAPQWVESRRPLVVLSTLAALLIVILFRAEVNAQSSAYATGVLALILSASVVVCMALWRESKDKSLSMKKSASLRKRAGYFGIVSLIFLYTFLDNIYSRPDGILIASLFFILIVIFSMMSRWSRSFELRVESHTFVNKQSEEMFQDIINKKVDLLPISQKKPESMTHSKNKIRKYYKDSNTIAFLFINLRDDRSQFMSPLRIKVKQIQHNKEPCYLIEVFGAVALANTIAYMSEKIQPNSLFLSLTRKNAMVQTLLYLLFGEGEIAVITYKVLVQYWESTPEEDKRPKIFLMSE